MNKEGNINNKKNELKNYSITLKKFLNIYFGFTDESLKNIEITHQDMKVLFPELVRISFEEVYTHMDELYKGNIIIVKDFNGTIAPYIRPKFEILTEAQDIDFCKESIDLYVSNLRELKKHELILLCKKLKKLRRYSEYRKATKQLRTSKDNDYKVKKRILREKENGNEY